MVLLTQAKWQQMVALRLGATSRTCSYITRAKKGAKAYEKRCRKAEREKEALQKENTDLKTEKSVADRVMYKKLGLAPHVIDKMKADAAREILQEQQRDDDVLF